MLLLIERLLPAALHRALLPIAHSVRHRWRSIRKAPLVGCQVVIGDRSGAIVLLRHSYGPKVWALPGGGVAKGELPDDAARREMAEELGLTIGPIDHVAVLEDIVSGSPHSVHIFRVVTDQMVKPDRREVVEARLFDRDALPANLSQRTAQCLALWRDNQSAQNTSEPD